MSGSKQWWSLAAILVFGLAQYVPAEGARASAYLRSVQTLTAEDSVLPALGGLPFPPGAGTLLVLEAEGGATLLLQPDAAGPGKLSLSAPIHTTFDARTGRLLAFDPDAAVLLELRPGEDGRLDPSAVRHSHAGPLGLRSPRGLTLDPSSGRLFLLDGAGPRIAQVDPDPARGLALATAAAEGRLAWIDLRSSGLSEPKGLAFDPGSGHLHVLRPADARLYELTPAGVVVAARDLPLPHPLDPAGMVFAPSADQTDDPARMSLYVATGAGPTARVSEFSLVEPLAAAPAAITSQSSLVQTIDTSQFSPPSPDPAGVAYLPGPGTLLVSDSEVNEMPIWFTGDNLFEVSLGGTLVDTATTISFSDEPTGVTFDPSIETFYFSDDTGTRSIYVVYVGADGVYGTADDAVTSFSTEDFGSNDPEGVTVGGGALWVVDGVNAEVYEITAGANGVFDGVPPSGDDAVSSFDTEGLGILDPEGIAFNTDTGNLYVIGEPVDQLAEITTAGGLVQMIDVSAANARAPAGLAHAPSSVAAGVMNIYIAARGVDNGSDPNENDGKVYEMTLPSASCLDDPDCDDGLFCNGTETCAASVCQAGADPCPGQGCDEATDTCTLISCNSNGVCEVGETCLTCSQDCISAPAGCGNGFCEPSLGENCLTCGEDCNGKQGGKPSRQFCCGDGAGSNPVGCGDSRCSSQGFACSDTPVGAYCCGDTVCEGAEEPSNCAVDCGAPPECGDGFCDVAGGESSCACGADCGLPPSFELDCADGLDEDCDGLIDGADPDCCSLGAARDPCSVDADCCSNRCRGKPGAKTCR